MAVSTTNAISGPFVANGVTTAFPFTFKCLDIDEVRVTLTVSDVESDVSSDDYSVTLNALGNGGTVTFDTAPAAGSVLIYSDPEFIQETGFASGQPFSPAVLNTALDRAAVRDQYLKREVLSALRMPQGENAALLPSVAARLGKFLAFDAGGDPIAASGTGADGALRADLATLLGALMVGVSHPALATGTARTVAAELQDRPSVMSIGTVTADGVTDDSAALQDFIDECEAEGYGYMHFPGFKGNYKLDAPLRFHLGDFLIQGDAGVRLTHPFTDGTSRTMRQGALVAGTSTTHLLDIGDYKTKPGGDPSPYAENEARNLAMANTVKNIAMRGSTTATTDGIRLTGIQNGPDRIFVLRELSGYNLNRGIYVPPPPAGVTIQAANLHVEDVSINYGQYGMLADGWVYGAVFNNVNFEGNALGAIHGVFNSAIQISNSMLENTKNPVNLTPVTSLCVRAWGNYFEAHSTSDYLYRVVGYDSYLQYQADINGDILGSAVGLPTDHVRLEYGGRWKIDADRRYSVLIRDIPLNETFIIDNGSTIFERQGALRIDRLRGTLAAGFGFARTDPGSTHTHSYPHDPAVTVPAQTPLGVMDVVDMADGMRVDFGETINGKLIEMSFMMRCDPAQAVAFPPAQFQARTPAAQFVNGPGAIIDYLAGDISQGEWKMITILWRGSNIVDIVEFFVDNALRGKVQIAGVTHKIHGTYAGDGTDGIKVITPVALNYKPAIGSVASASTVTLPLSEVTKITGTTNIANITATRCAGRRVTLIFADVLTVTDGGNLKLSANLTTAANTTLTLVCDGTNWFEVGRSAN